MLSQELWIALGFVDVALIILCFISCTIPRLRDYWFNMGCAMATALISFGLESWMRSGIMDTAGTVVSDAMLADWCKWLGYAMAAMIVVTLFVNLAFKGAQNSSRGY